MNVLLHAGNGKLPNTCQVYMTNFSRSVRRRVYCSTQRLVLPHVLGGRQLSAALISPPHPCFFCHLTLHHLSILSPQSASFLALVRILAKEAGTFHGNRTPVEVMIQRNMSMSKCVCVCETSLILAIVNHYGHLCNVQLCPVHLYL